MIPGNNQEDICYSPHELLKICDLCVIQSSMVIAVILETEKKVHQTSLYLQTLYCIEICPQLKTVLNYAHVHLAGPVVM